jgi:hypothetical protein
MTYRGAISATVALVALTALSRAELRATGFQATDDHYVIVSSDTTRAEAEAKTVMAGAWVLDTNLYPKLTRNLYAVVWGPFSDRSDARAVLAFLRGAYPDAYIRDAGAPVASTSGGTQVPSAAVASLLGDVAVEIARQPGGRNGCEPQEPYLAVGVSGGNALEGFHVVERTGEVRRRGACALEFYRQYLALLDVDDPYSVSRALAHYKWHFTPTGLLNLNDSALVEFHRLQDRAYWRYRRVLRDLDQDFLEALSEDETPQDSAALEIHRTLDDNGFAVGTPGYRVPAYQPGYTLIEDPEFLLNTFSDRTTEAMQEFLEIRREEQREFVSGGRYSFDLGNPLVVWEAFIAANPDFVWHSEAASYYKNRLEQYFVGRYRGPPIFDIEDGSAAMVTVYDWFLERYPDTETGKLTARYYDVLRAGDFKCTEQVEQFLFGIDLADLVVGGRPLFARGSDDAKLFPGRNLGGGVYFECHADDDGETMRTGTLANGRGYALLRGPQGSDTFNQKAWLVCRSADGSGDARKSPLLQYSMYHGDLDEWAQELSEEQIAEFAARYCN